MAILLLGGIDLAEPHLDLDKYALDVATLVGSGGNVHRWTIADFTDKTWPSRRRQPFYWDGSKYILTQKNANWWLDFKAVLDLAKAAGVILQIEWIDIWNLRDGPIEARRWYRDSCWGPLRNNDYGVVSGGSGMPDDFITSDTQVMAGNKFYTSVTGGVHAKVLAAQELYLTWMVEECIGYEVLFQIENESVAPITFSSHFVDLIHSVDVDAMVTDMQINMDESSDDYHAMTDPRFQFGEASQVGYEIENTNKQETLDECFTRIVALRNRGTKPINNTKIYNGHDTSGHQVIGLGNVRMGIHVMAGVASASHHPSNAGEGISAAALSTIAMLRWSDNLAHLSELTPVSVGSGKWEGSRPDANNHTLPAVPDIDHIDVSAWAMESNQEIVIFLNGTVNGLTFDTRGLGGTMTKIWYDAATEGGSGEGNVSTGQFTDIINPTPGELAIIVMSRVG